jgi:hypothetical protein
MTIHILLDTNGYIDMCLNTRLVHDLYLKSMEGHFLMIDCEKLICKLFFFCINILPQVAMLVRVDGLFPSSEGFNHVIYIVILIFDLFV